MVARPRISQRKVTRHGHFATVANFVSEVGCRVSLTESALGPPCDQAKGDE